MTDPEPILNAIKRIRISPQPEEYEIHSLIDDLLNQAGIEHIHEYKLMPGRRIDFICGDIGIEVKKGRPRSAALKSQLERYLASDALSGIIVVLQKPCYLPEHICGKSVYTVALNRLWGVALP